MNAQSQARAAAVLEQELADLLEEQGDELYVGSSADDLSSRVTLVRAWLQGMEKEAAQLKALVDLAPAQRHRQRFLPVNIGYCQEIISKYDELQRSRSACAGNAVVSVEPVSTADEADPSTADHNALPYAQRLEAILRAPRLPDVINLASVQNPENWDYYEEDDYYSIGKPFKELSGSQQERLVDWHITHDYVALTAQQRAQLLHQMNAHTNVTMLNLSGNAHDSRELLEAIRNQKNLKTLDLSWNDYSVYIGQYGREEKFVLSALKSLSRLKHLNLRGTNFEAGYFSAALKSLTGLQHLNLGHNVHGVYPGGCYGGKRVASWLRRLTNLQHLDLRNNGLGSVHDRHHSDSEEHVASALMSLTALKHLDLSSNHLQKEEHVSAALKLLTGLQYLDLSGNYELLRRRRREEVEEEEGGGGGVDGGEHFSAALKLLTGLTHLDLSGTGPGPHAAAHVVSALITLTALQHLDLACFNCLGSHGASVLSSLTNLKHLNLSHSYVVYVLAELKFLTGLQYLDLSDNNFGPDNSERVSAALELLTGLRHLDLRKNYFQRDCGEHIADGLKSLTLLQYLDLSVNYFEGDGLAHVASALMSLTALQHLDLTENQLGADGGELVLAALTNLTGLTYLDLSDNSLGHDAGAYIASALMTLINLKHLDLSSNGIGPQEGEHFSAALKLLTGLQYLNLSRNTLGPDAGAHVASALICLTDLQHLSVMENGFDASTDASVVCFCSSLPKFHSLHTDMPTKEFMKHFAFENPKNALDRAQSYWYSCGQHQHCYIVMTDTDFNSVMYALDSEWRDNTSSSLTDWSPVIKYLGAFHPLYSLLLRAAAACHVFGPRDANAHFLQPRCQLRLHPPHPHSTAVYRAFARAMAAQNKGMGSKMARVRLRRLLRFSCISSTVAARLCSRSGFVALIIRRCLSERGVRDMLSVYLFEPKPTPIKRLGWGDVVDDKEALIEWGDVVDDKEALIEQVAELELRVAQLERENMQLRALQSGV